MNFTCRNMSENDLNINGKHLVELLNLNNFPEKSVLSAFRSGKY